MWDFKLMAALRTIESSMAYVLYRLGLCLGAAVGSLLATLAGAGTLVGFASLAKNASAIGPLGASLGFVLFGFVLYTLRRLWLRTVDLPHLALLARQWQGEPLPSGAALIGFAKGLRDRAYPSQTQLDGLLTQILAIESSRAGHEPCPLIERSPDFIRPLFRKAQSLLAQKGHRTVLAWTFTELTPTPERALSEALSTESRHFPLLLRNRLLATLFTWVGLVFAYPLVLKGIDILVDGIPIQLGLWPWVFAGVFSLALKSAFFDPIAESALLQLTFPMIQAERNGPLDATLLNVSPAFRALIDAAEGPSGARLSPESRADG